MDVNSKEALVRRRKEGRLTWSGPALMLFARSVFAVLAQGVVAAGFAVRGSQASWHDAEPWLPLYGTLIDAGCLALLWRLTRREGIRLLDLIGLLASVPHSLFVTLVYLRLRRLLPLALAHALMDGATVLIPLLTT